MVQPRYRVVVLFAVFVLPALLLYAVFFLYPFAQGIRISFTNWDGLTPRTPISMPKGDFESQILGRIASQADRDFVLSLYHLDPADNQYKRLYVTGLPRYRLQRVLHRIGYEPQSYRVIGFANYVQIFSGKVEQRFYPHMFTKTNFNEDSGLPASIPRSEFEQKFLANLKNPADRDFASRYYVLDKDAYGLRPRFDEFSLEDRIWLLPEVAAQKTVSSESVDGFISAMKAAGLRVDDAAINTAVSAFLRDNRFSAASAAEVQGAARDIYGLGTLKKMLAENWTDRKFEMGVVGFTLFFTFFNVLLSNLLAFFFALALDSGIKSQRVLRSIIFLPNVLSMIIVALVWSFVFFNLLPKLTGIELWMGDPAKTPWLLVLVQVWQQSGYLMVIYLAGMSTVPTDVLEASSIDGATFLKRLRHITLPLLVPAFTICLFLSLSNSLKSFDLVYAMQGPSGYATGTVPFVMDIFFDAFAKKQAGLGTAKAILLFLLIALVTGVQLSISKRREVQL
jgi:raffinose/stachyose/melibiose transport system permease protein